MNKTCARCEKTVYPTEELKCLDKVNLLYTFYYYIKYFVYLYKKVILVRGS